MVIPVVSLFLLPASAAVLSVLPSTGQEDVPLDARMVVVLDSPAIPEIELEVNGELVGFSRETWGEEERGLGFVGIYPDRVLEPDSSVLIRTWSGDEEPVVSRFRVGSQRVVSGAQPPRVALVDAISHETGGPEAVRMTVQITSPDPDPEGVQLAHIYQLHSESHELMSPPLATQPWRGPLSLSVSARVQGWDEPPCLVVIMEDAAGSWSDPSVPLCVGSGHPIPPELGKGLANPHL